MLSVAFAGATPEKGTCVIGPNQGSNAESLGQGVVTQAGSVCDASTEGCGACLEQCAPYKKIKDLYGCHSLCIEDDWCNPMCAAGEDPDCIVDNDGDGYASDVDCDDNNAEVNPGAVEVCDGIDNDCNGIIDDGLICEDQANDVGATISYGCGITPGGLGSLFQSFTPGASPLVAVDIRLRAGGGFPDEGYDTVINIREGTHDGDVLGTATTFVTTLIGTQIVVNFELPEIEVTPGNTYVIEWISPGDSVLTWMGPGSDTYAGGTAFGCTGITISYLDFIFTTYTIA